MDTTKIEAAITPKTKAIVPVHYAGVGCNMTQIQDIARRHHLYVIEDAAQGVHAFYKNKPLGTWSDLGAYSFHGTKNIVSGEGGALLIQKESFIHQAEIYREKGTDRSRFFKGQIDKYTWQDKGSSFLPSELTAALLYSQLQKAEEITHNRLHLWNMYHGLLAPLEEKNCLTRPFIPSDCTHNAHIYYLILPTEHLVQDLIRHLKHNGITALNHYFPLHISPAGQQFGRVHGSMTHTEDLPNRLVRLPLYAELSQEDLETVVSCIFDFFTM